MFSRSANKPNKNVLSLFLFIQNKLNKNLPARLGVGKKLTIFIDCFYNTYIYNQPVFRGPEETRK